MGSGSIRIRDPWAEDHGRVRGKRGEAIFQDDDDEEDRRFFLANAGSGL